MASFSRDQLLLPLCHQRAFHGSLHRRRGRRKPRPLRFQLGLVPCPLCLHESIVPLVQSAGANGNNQRRVRTWPFSPCRFSSRARSIHQSACSSLRPAHRQLDAHVRRWGQTSGRRKGGEEYKGKKKKRRSGGKGRNASTANCKRCGRGRSQQRRQPNARWAPSPRQPLSSRQSSPHSHMHAYAD